MLALALTFVVLSGCDTGTGTGSEDNAGNSNSGNSINPFTGYWSSKTVGQSSGFQLNLYADATATGGSYALQVLPENTVTQSGNFTRTNNTATFNDAQGVPVGNGGISGSILTLTIKAGTITYYDIKFTKL